MRNVQIRHRSIPLNSFLPGQTRFNSHESQTPLPELTLYYVQGFSNLLDRIDRLSSLHPVAISVTWGAGGSTKDRSLDLAGLTQSEYGVETILHLTCTNMEGGMIDDALKVRNNYVYYRFG